MTYPRWFFTHLSGIPDGFLDSFNKLSIDSTTTHIGYALDYNSTGKLTEFDFTPSELKEYSTETELQFLPFEDFKIALFKHKVLNL